VPVLGVGGGDFQVPICGGSDDRGAHLHQVLLLLEPVGVGGQADAVPSPCDLHTTSAQPQTPVLPLGRPPAQPSSPTPQRDGGRVLGPGELLQPLAAPNPAPSRALVPTRPVLGAFPSGVTGPPSSEVPFASIPVHKEGLGPRSSPVPGASGMGCAGTTCAAHAGPPPVQDMPLSPSPPWGGCDPQDPSGVPWRSRQRGPCPSSVGPQGCGAGSPQCASGPGLSCPGSCPLGEEGECKHPEHASTCVGGQRGVWDPRHSSPCLFGTPGWGWVGFVLGSGPPPISVLPLELGWLFSVPAMKSLCIHSHPTAQDPNASVPAPQAGAWVLPPSRATEPPETWGCGCTLPSTRASLAPATPSPHISRASIPPKHPKPPRRGRRLGHLVLLEVGLHRHGVLRVQCPEQGQPQDAEQRGVHVCRRAEPSRAEPSRAEPSRARGAGRAAVPERRANPYLWAGCAVAPGGPARPPPSPPLCKRAQGRASKPKGRRQNQQMFPSC